MPFCVTCQQHRPNAAVFCPECGQRLTQPQSPTFDIHAHLRTLHQEGWLQIKLRQDSDHTQPRRYQQAQWDPAKYLEGIWRALTRGGFSYFTQVGEERHETFTTGVLLTTEHTVATRPKAPILLPQEQLQKVSDIRTPSLEGQLYYTGQRFLFDVTAFELALSRSDEVGKHFIFTQPLYSLWIKPDFSELLRLTGRNALRETGTFRKQQYHHMTFQVHEVKRLGRRQPHAVYCGYLWEGPDGELVDDDATFIFATPNDDPPAEIFAETLRDLIHQATSTPVTELLAYTYHCHAQPEAMIATALNAGVRRMQEHPYAHWSTFPIIV
jgi:hypothetical protein